jgi:hypothetical protein
MGSVIRSTRWPLVMIVMLSLIISSLACDININIPTESPPSDTGDAGDQGDTGDPGDQGDTQQDQPPADLPTPTCDSLTFDPQILGVGVVTEVIPEVPPGDMPPASPEHMRYTLTGYPVGLSVFDAYIELFSVPAYISGAPYVSDLRDTLRQIIINRPPAPSGQVWIPSIYNAGEMMSTAFEYLSFANGDGIRYLTQYGQAYTEVNNEYLLYTYQGLTSGDECWVSVIFPVNHSSLPDVGGIPSGDPDAYYAGIEASLGAEHPDSFNPSLLLLDALIQSIVVN